MRSTPKPRKRFGQHFLVDRDAVRRIVDALSPGPGQGVLEVGPGRGALTSALIQRAGRIAAVEVDRDLVRDLRRRFPAEQLALFEQDVLRFPLGEALTALDLKPPARLAVAGNLPYNVSKPLAFKLIDDHAIVERAVLMFQREVAQRLTARPGQRDYGPLGILLGFVYDIRTLFHLPPTAFRPRPAVTSTVTRWTARPAAEVPERLLPALRACLKASFGHRRQTLLNNLRAALQDRSAAQRLIEAAALDGSLRPGAIAPEGYLSLAARWPAP